MELKDNYHWYLYVKNHIKLEGVNNIVLSHPIAGSDKSGIDALDKNLFIEKRIYSVILFMQKKTI